MVPHRLVPLALLAVLTVLTAGFAVLALTMSPSGADLTVHNGTAETFSARQFILSLTAPASSAQGTAETDVRVIDYSAPDRMDVYQATPKLKLLGSLRPDAITQAIDGYVAITAGSVHWVREGTFFHRTETLQAFEARQGEDKSPAGTVNETAVVRGGYLVALDLNLRVKSQTATNGQTVPGPSEDESLHLLRINGAKAPTVNP